MHLTSQDRLKYAVSAAVATVLAGAVYNARGAGNFITQDNLLLGENLSSPNGVVVVNQGNGTESPIAVPTIESLRLDNYGGILHNGAGNLLGVNYGAAPTATGGGGTIYSIATDGTSTNQSVFTFPAADPLASRLGGISVSPNNNYVAVNGYDTGDVYLLNYTAGNTHGAGASISSTYSASNPNLLSTVPTDNSTIFLDNNNLLGFGGNGSLIDFNIAGHVAGASLGNGTVLKSGMGTIGLNGTAAGFTSLALTPGATGTGGKSYLFAASSYFNSTTGDYRNVLNILDATSTATLAAGPVDTVNLSSQMATDSTDIAFDSKGNLFVTQYSNLGYAATQVYELPNAAALATTLSTGNDAITLAQYGSPASFPGLEAAWSPAPPPNGRILTWGAVGGTGPSDVNGTWNAANANWNLTPGSSNIVFNDANSPPDNATFGAGTGVTGTNSVTVVGTHNVGSLGFNANSNIYTLTGGTIQINGDGFGNGIIAKNNATIASALVLEGTSQLVNPASGVTLTISGPISGGALNVVGSGTLVLSNASNTQSGLTISHGEVQVATNAPLGGGAVTFQGGELTTTAAVAFPASRIFQLTTNGTLNTKGFSDTIQSGIVGGTGTQINKIGTGTLTLAAPSPNFHGGTIIQSGTVVVNSVDANNVSGLGAGPTDSQNFDNGVQIESNAKLQIANIAFGKPSVTTGTPPNTTTTYYTPDIFISDKGTLLATGTSSYDGGYIHAIKGTVPASPLNQTIATAASTDVFSIKTEFRQWDAGNKPYNVGDSNAIVHLSGPGRVVLQSGGVESSDVFAGSWEVDTGTLQIGPVVPDPTPNTGTNGYAGPFGEPLNALGFKSPDGTFGDPDQPNAINVKGGIFAIAVDAPNTNPNITVPPVNSTPNYIRNAVTLSGGAIASSGLEVSYSASPTGPQGVPTSTPVSAQIGGSFTVTGTGSRVLTYDPTLGGARTISLVGGTRTLVNSSPYYPMGTVLTYATNWNGNLTVDPGSTTGGVFNINRDGGTVSVTPGATISILTNATVNAGGMADAFTDTTTSTKHVAVSNNGVFNVTSGSKTVANITGTGSTTANASTTLSAGSITQNSLTVNGTVHILPGPGPQTPASTSVVNSLTLAGPANGPWTGKLDVGNSAFVVQAANAAAAATAEATIYAQLRQGAHDSGSNPTWNGTGGIVSSLLAGGSTSNTVGEALNTFGYTTFGGKPVNANSILVGYTLSGDVNMDGTVDANDINVILGNFGNFGPGVTYGTGDANYDNTVDANDLNLVLNNFGNFQSAVSVYTSDHLSSDGIALEGNHFVVVPEPTSLGLLAFSGLLLARRRRIV